MAESESSKQTEARVMRKTSKEEFEKQTGKYDDDGFYMLEAGGFFDPNGYYFDKDGVDASGGKYDDQGVYVPGNLSAGFSRSEKLVAMSKEEIMKQHPDGKEDEDGFYVLKDGDFFDPFGFYFDVDGFDVTGGSYDNQGYYRRGEERPVAMTREQIEKLGLEGKFDEDDFYILKDGDFYDPLGYYFDKDGFDENGGRYDEQGYYIPCASEVTDARQLVLTKEEIQALHPEGSFDEDGFYKLKDGDYFDPFGFYFNSEGLDSNGGNYDEAGYYQPGTSRDKSMLPISKDEIMKQPGKYSETGFYNLTAGGFYDQFGYFFNEHGLDEVGGFYENGIYQHPDEEYKDEEQYGNEDYGAEETDKYSLDALEEDELLEREAILNEHVLPAQFKVKQDRLHDKSATFYLRIANLPEYFDEQACLAFFTKQVPNFKQSKMVPITVKKGLSNLLTGNILIQTSDIQTIDKLLTLHGRKIDGYPLSCWLMGHEHLETDDYNSAFDPNIFVQQFDEESKSSAKHVAKTAEAKPKQTHQNPEAFQTQDDEEFQIVTKKKTVVEQDEEFEIIKKS